MIWKLKRGVCEAFSDVFGKNCKDMFVINEYIVVSYRYFLCLLFKKTVGTVLNPEYKAENLKGRLRRAKTMIDPKEKTRIQAK